jgi:hypothetical protein
MPGELSTEIPDHVAVYMLERMISLLPDEVVKVLVSLTPEQIKGLRELGEAFDSSGASAELWVFGVH